MMVHHRGRWVFWTLCVLVICVLMGIGIATAMGRFGTKQDAPSVSVESQSVSTDAQTIAPTDEASSSTETQTSSNTADQEVSSIDQTTLKVIVVEPMGIAVSYAKDAGPFSFEVMRATNGTRYVEFRSDDLIGTKCTNDAGAFASVIENVRSAEDASTVVQTVTVSSVPYGLSLTGESCTADTTLLLRYQKAFRDGFAFLKQL